MSALAVACIINAAGNVFLAVACFFNSRANTALAKSHEKMSQVSAEFGLTATEQFISQEQRIQDLEMVQRGRIYPN